MRQISRRVTYISTSGLYDVCVCKREGECVFLLLLQCEKANTVNKKNQQLVIRLVSVCVCVCEIVCRGG